MENENTNNNETFNPPPFTPEPFNEEKPARGGCLSAFLILMIIGNSLAVLLYLGMGSEIARKAHIPKYAPYLLVIFGLINILCAFGIYKYKRAGVYGIVASGVITLIMNLAFGLGPTSFGGLIGIIILIALVSKNWEHFD